MIAGTELSDTAGGPAVLRGMTWDHPRGYRALDAWSEVKQRAEVKQGAVAMPGSCAATVRWDRQPLAGFESRPLAELAVDYDLMIIDHPGLGESVRDGAVLPMEELFEQAELAGWETDIIGESYRSYRLDGRQWAIPLDAAAQVGMVSAELAAAESTPDTWPAALEFAAKVPTALCLGGPHALLMFQAVSAAISEAPAPWLDRSTGRQALELIAALFVVADQELSLGNPITVLDAMAAGRAAYCPLVYGYVSYQHPSGTAALRAIEAPLGESGRRGSVLGGTGIAVSSQCQHPQMVAEVIRELLSPRVQGQLFARHGGQGATSACWTDSAVDAVAHGFYSSTRQTLEQAWVRPRSAGYIPFQRDGSAIIREAVIAGDVSDAVLDKLYQRYQESGDDHE